MEQKTLILTVILVISQAVLMSQNHVPKALLSAIPGKYKITNESYHKADFIVNIDILLEIPSKYGCDSNKELYNPTTVSIGIYIINNADVAKMQEDMMPFSNYLPTNESHKPQIDFWHELVTFSGTTLVELPRGRGAYYTWTRKCIKSQNDEYYGVSLEALFGCHWAKTGIGVTGNIDASEAVSILKELHGILNKINFQNL